MVPFASAAPRARGGISPRTVATVREVTVTVTAGSTKYPATPAIKRSRPRAGRSGSPYAGKGNVSAAGRSAM